MEQHAQGQAGTANPTQSQKPQSPNSMRWLLVLIVGLALGGVSCACLCTGTLWFAFTTARAINQPRSLDDPRVKLEGVSAEMTLAELEAHLGPGRKVSFDELPLADPPTPGKQDRAQIDRLSKRYRIQTWYLWTGKDRWVYAGFRIRRSSIVGRYVKGPDGRESTMLHDSENTLP